MMERGKKGCCRAILWAFSSLLNHLYCLYTGDDWGKFVLVFHSDLHFLPFHVPLVTLFTFHSSLFPCSARHLKIGVTHTEGGGLSHTGIPGLTQTVFEVTSGGKNKGAAPLISVAPLYNIYVRAYYFTSTFRVVLSALRMMLMPLRRVPDCVPKGVKMVLRSSSDEAATPLMPTRSR